MSAKASASTAMDEPSWKDAPELVFGMIRAIGTDVSVACAELTARLTDAQFVVERIKLSKLLSSVPCLGPVLAQSPEEKRYESHMDAGDILRGATGYGHAVALLGIRELRQKRKGLIAEKPVRVGPSQPVASERPRGRAYILESLMHPEELRALKAIYGNQFFAVAVFSTYQDRFQRLSERLARSSVRQPHEVEPRTTELINRDMGLGVVAGALHRKLYLDVRGTFERADLYVASGAPEESREATKRFVELLFSHPYHTPTRDEFGMTIAYATSSHSGSLSRRVGACITSSDGEIIATGTNEVARAGGGVYWPGDSPDARDHQLGTDSSDSFRLDMLKDATRRILRALNHGDDELTSVLASPEMREASLLDVGEFGRAVHAEMAALMDAVRRGVSVKGATLYCTTFPCHVCARHIVAAGIGRVVYIEPYPKSRVSQLFRDSIGLADRASNTGNLVRFEPFLGIAPRGFTNLFSWVARKRDDQERSKREDHGVRSRDDQEKNGSTWLSGRTIDWSLSTGALRDTILEKTALLTGVRSKAIRVLESRGFVEPFEQQLSRPDLADVAGRIRQEIESRRNGR